MSLEMKGDLPRLGQSKFCFVSSQILTGNERKLASACSEQIFVICYQLLIGKERKLAPAGSWQMLVDLLLNSDWKCKEIGVGWLRADFSCLAIRF